MNMTHPTTEQRELLELAAANKVMRLALEQFASCDLNTGNCASVEVAAMRVRTIAGNALRAAAAIAKGEK